MSDRTPMLPPHFPIRAYGGPLHDTFVFHPVHRTYVHMDHLGVCIYRARHLDGVWTWGLCRELHVEEQTA